MTEESSRILDSAARMLEFARQGQSDFLAGGDRRLSGLYTAITSARSVTFTLQNLRNKVDNFDDWYGPIREQLSADPVCAWFVTLRNNIEKRGDHGGHSVSVHITSLNTGDLQRSAPPGTKSTIIGDSLGRSYWVVQLPDGTEQKVFFRLPEGLVKAGIHIEGAPGGRSVEELLEIYLHEIEGVLRHANAKFR